VLEISAVAKILKFVPAVYIKDGKWLSQYMGNIREQFRQHAWKENIIIM
jgi:hypothetical protein